MYKKTEPGLKLVDHCIIQSSRKKKVKNITKQTLNNQIFKYV